MQFRSKSCRGGSRLDPSSFLQSMEQTWLLSYSIPPSLCRFVDIFCALMSEWVRTLNIRDMEKKRGVNGVYVASMGEIDTGSFVRVCRKLINCR